MVENVVIDYLENLKKKYSKEIFKIRPVSFRIFCEKYLEYKLPDIKYEIAERILGSDPEKWNTKIQEIYLLAGKGGGKDWFIGILFTYVGYWLKCLNNVQRYFGLPDGSPIDFGNVSISSLQAKSVFFKYLKNNVRRAINPDTGNKWFAEQGMDLRDEMDIQTRKIIFSPEQKFNITAYSLDSEKYTGEGLNLLLVVMDEVGAFRFQRAQQLYDNLRSTEKSRFRLFRKLALISYKYDDNDFMQFKWNDEKDNMSILKLGPYATWELNPTTTKEDFADDYRKWPNKSQRIYECKGSNKEQKFFDYDKFCLLTNKMRVSPLISDSITIEDLPALKLYNWFRGNNIYEIETERDGNVKNQLVELHSNSVYHVHIDLAKAQKGSDCVGLAMGHRVNYSSTNYKIYIDLMMQLKGKNGGEIKFEEIRNFIYYSKDILGFNIRVVTLDGYQSLDFVQLMKSRGYKSYVVSIDKTKEGYETFQGLMYEGRLNYYSYKPFNREVKELEERNGKIDHPVKSMQRDKEENDDRGSKDVTDSVAGVCLTLIKNYEKTNTVSIVMAGADYDEDDDD